LPEFEKALMSTSAESSGSLTPIVRPTASATTTMTSVNAATPATIRTSVPPLRAVVATLWKISAGART